MKALVADLRLMTGVGTETLEIAGAKHYSDEDLERKLENRVGERMIQVPVAMAGRLEYTGEGSSSRLALKDGKVNFEGTLDVETAELVTFWGAPIEGDVMIFGDGRIEFAESQLAKTPLLTGTTYDLNGAAADVLTDWASAVKLGYDISTDSQELKRSQRHEQLLEQAEAFRKRALISSVQMSRTDLNPAAGGRTKAILESFDKWGLYPQSTPNP